MEGDVVPGPSMQLLLLYDDWRYTHGTCMTSLDYLPSGSLVEGGFLARNVRHERRLQVEQDYMDVFGYVTDELALHMVGDTHMLVRQGEDVWIDPWVLKTIDKHGLEAYREGWVHGTGMKMMWEKNLRRRVPHTAASYMLGSGCSIEGQWESSSNDLDILVASINQGLQEIDKQYTEESIDQYLSKWESIDCLLDEIKRHFIVLYTPIREGIVESYNRVKHVIKQEANNDTPSPAPVIQAVTSFCDAMNTTWKTCGYQVITDDVICLATTFFPSICQEWVARARVWPPVDIINLAALQGCHLVSKPPHDLDRGDVDKELCWRISFSMCEKVLARSRTPRQRETYYTFKLLYYKYITNVRDSQGDSLKSFAAKTTMFYVTEQHPPDWWEINDTRTTVICLFEHLLERVVSGNMPHYFIPNANLFHAWGTRPELRDRVAEKIKEILAEPETSIKLDDGDLERLRWLPCEAGSDTLDTSKINKLHSCLKSLAGHYNRLQTSEAMSSEEEIKHILSHSKQTRKIWWDVMGSMRQVAASICHMFRHLSDSPSYGILVDQSRSMVNTLLSPHITTVKDIICGKDEDRIRFNMHKLGRGNKLQEHIIVVKEAVQKVTESITVMHGTALFHTKSKRYRK